MKEKIQQLIKERNSLKNKLEELQHQYKCNFEEAIGLFGFNFYNDADNFYHQELKDGSYLEGSNAVSFEINDENCEEYTIHVCWHGDDFQEYRYFDDPSSFFEALSTLQDKTLSVSI